MDSSITANILRAGIVAAARRGTGVSAEVTPPSSPSHRRQRSESSDLGLSSVRPGHEACKVYDPDAALSVAARLAKELEEDRATTAAALAESSRAGSRGAEAQGPRVQEPTAPAARGRIRDRVPIIKRSLSMSAVARSRLSKDPRETKAPKPEPPPPNMRREGPPATAPKPVVNTEAAIRRLRVATEGRGIAALKKHSNGKSRSRVMIRCRIEAGTIAWAHVLPPFTRKSVPAQQLVGASRSSKVVTLLFKDRDPVGHLVCSWTLGDTGDALHIETPLEDP